MAQDLFHSITTMESFVTWNTVFFKWLKADDKIVEEIIDLTMDALKEGYNKDFRLEGTQAIAEPTVGQVYTNLSYFRSFANREDSRAIFTKTYSKLMAKVAGEMSKINDVSCSLSMSRENIFRFSITIDNPDFSLLDRTDGQFEGFKNFLKKYDETPEADRATAYIHVKDDYCSITDIMYANGKLTFIYRAGLSHRALQNVTKFYDTILVLRNVEKVLRAKIG